MEQEVPLKAGYHLMMFSFGGSQLNCVSCVHGTSQKLGKCMAITIVSFK
jgi:hypothetical protein